ncbi:hypothetical protein ABPG74_009022 [Tetrahymena malaccensis]
MSQTFQSEKQLQDDQQTTFCQLLKLLMVENKSVSMIEELKEALRQFIYFQTLFHFIQNIFPCFNFINTFIQLFEVANEGYLNTDNQGDLIVRVCLESIQVSEVQGNSFLEQYNWSQFARKCRNIQNQTKPITKIDGELDKDIFIKDQQDKDYKYLVIQQSKFMICLKKYQNQRQLIYSNVIKCIPQVQQINSKRMQDNIIKSIESINLFEGTIINHQQDQFVTPRKQKLQKFKKDALWFLISGNGVIEQKVNEVNTVPISTISEGSLFGEEILFQDLINEQEDGEINSSLEDIKQFKEQIMQSQERFQLRITSKLGKMYCIQKEQILFIFPKKIIKEIQKNYIQKFNNRKEILKSKIECQNQQNFQASEKKINIRRQFSEILNISNILTKQSDQMESLINSQEDIIMQKLIDKKQMLLKLQENQVSKKVFFIESPQTSQRDRDGNEYQKAEGKSSKEVKKKPSIQLVLKQKNVNDKKEINQSSLNENQKFFSQDSESNINSSYKTLLSQQAPSEKRHLKKKILNIINQGYDFGTKDKQAEYNKEHAIKMLSLKNGIINPITKVKHPSLYEKQEKIILKQQQRIQSVSIARLLDKTPSQQSIYSCQQFNQENNNINIASLRNVGDKKQSFYLTPKESINCQSARLDQKYQTSFSSKLLRYNTIDNIKAGSTADFTLSQNKINSKSSNSIKRPSDQTKADEMSLIQYGLNLIQIPNNELSEKNKTSIMINKTLNLSGISDNNKQKSFALLNQNNQHENTNLNEFGSLRELFQNKETSFADFVNNKSNRKKKLRCFSNIFQDSNCTEEENAMNQKNNNEQGFTKKLFRQKTYNSFNELLDISQIGSKNNNIQNSQIFSYNNQSSKQFNHIFSDIIENNFLKKETNCDLQKSQDAIFNQINKSNQQSARNTTKISQLLEENEKIQSEKKEINFHKKYNNMFANIKFNKIISRSPSFDQIYFKQIQNNKLDKNEFNNNKEQLNQQINKIQESQQGSATQTNLFRSSANNSPHFNLDKNSENSYNVNGQKIQLQEKYVQIKSSKGEYIRLNSQLNQIDSNQNSNRATQDQTKVIHNINTTDKKLVSQQSSAQTQVKNSQILQNKEMFKNIRLRSSQQFYKSPKNLLQLQKSDQKHQVNTDQSCLMGIKKSTYPQQQYQSQRCATQDKCQENTMYSSSQALVALSNELNSQQNISIINKNEDQQQQIFGDDTFGIQNRKNLYLQTKLENCDSQNDFTSNNNIHIQCVKQNEISCNEKQQQLQQNSPNQKFNFKSYLLQKAKHNQAIKRKNLNKQKDFEQPNLFLMNQQIQISELKKS